jgi:hypothetical protein
MSTSYASPSFSFGRWYEALSSRGRADNQSTLSSGVPTVEECMTWIRDIATALKETMKQYMWCASDLIDAVCGRQRNDIVRERMSWSTSHDLEAAHHEATRHEENHEAIREALAQKDLELKALRESHRDDKIVESQLKANVQRDRQGIDHGIDRDLPPSKCPSPSPQ